ncbi:hypothetical protein [Luteimicrobium album]|uniref:hypothetical protein n=1 Tax=Luteimicrobium album TaxID=1054550 RepID=UPI003D6695ED
MRRRERRRPARDWHRWRVVQRAGRTGRGLLASRTVTQIAASGNHTCALSGGQMYCWGQNTSGELGDGTTTNRASP